MLHELKNVRMEPKYIYFKMLDLDNENKFNIELPKENVVEKVKLKKSSYFLMGLKINPKIEDDITNGQIMKE